MFRGRACVGWDDGCEWGTGACYRAKLQQHAFQKPNGAFEANMALLMRGATYWEQHKARQKQFEGQCRAPLAC